MGTDHRRLRHDVQLIADYVDGESEPSQAVEAEERIRACWECADIFRDLRRTSAAMRIASKPVPVPEAIGSRIRADTNPRLLHGPRLNSTPVQLLSAVSLSLLIAFAYLSRAEVTRDGVDQQAGLTAKANVQTHNTMLPVTHGAASTIRVTQDARFVTFHETPAQLKQISPQLRAS